VTEPDPEIRLRDAGEIEALPATTQAELNVTPIGDEEDAPVAETVRGVDA